MMRRAFRLFGNTPNSTTSDEGINEENDTVSTEYYLIYLKC